MTIDAFSPREVTEAVSNAGVQKGNQRLEKAFLSAVSAGCLLAFACGTVLSTNASPWFQDNAGGLIRIIGALVFPYGLCMIILTGADLCTGSFMVRTYCVPLIWRISGLMYFLQYTTVAALQRRLPWYKMLLHWVVTFLGNLAGSLFVAIILLGCK